MQKSYHNLHNQELQNLYVLLVDFIVEKKVNSSGFGNLRVSLTLFFVSLFLKMTNNYQKHLLGFGIMPIEYLLNTNQVAESN